MAIAWSCGAKHVHVGKEAGDVFDSDGDDYEGGGGDCSFW